MKPACILTGATGYIGSHLANRLLAGGWDIHAITRKGSSLSLLEDMRGRISVFEYNQDIHSLIAYFQKTGADVVFHLAASVVTQHRSEQLKEIIQSNVQFGTEVLEAMMHCDTRLFVNTGTYWQNYETSDYNPVNLYAAMKEAFGKILKYYVEAHGFRVLTLRLFDVYGEDDNRPKLLSLLKRAAETGDRVDISPGEQYLNMLHVSDVCEAYLKAYELLKSDTKLRNEVYDICSGEEIQLRQLVSLLFRTLGWNIHVNIGGKAYRDREILKPVKCHKKLPGWEPRISLQQGLTLFNIRGGVKCGIDTLKFAA